MTLVYGQLNSSFFGNSGPTWRYLRFANFPKRAKMEFAYAVLRYFAFVEPKC